MDYILCEDSKAGYFFWHEINRVFFKSKYQVQSSNGIAELYAKIEKINFNTSKSKYLLCIDCCMDNVEVKPFIMKLRKICMKYPDKLFMTDYICFEQMVLSSPKINLFLNGICNNKNYIKVMQHISSDYTDVNEFVKLFGLSNNKHATSEKMIASILQGCCIVKKDRIMRNDKPFDKLIFKHNYITKESWSKCWLTDCINGCPEKLCWKTKYDCDVCNQPMSNSSCIKSETYNHSDRKFEEELHCDRKLPIKMTDRIKLLFEGSILSKMMKDI